MNQKGQRISLWKTINQYIAMIALDWQRFVQDFPVALIGPKLQVNTPNLWKHQQINKLKTQKTSKCNAPLQPQESHYFTQNLNLNYEFELGEDTVFLPNLIIPNSDYTRRRPRWEWSSWLHLHYALEFNVLNTVWRVK